MSGARGLESTARLKQASHCNDEDCDSNQITIPLQMPRRRDLDSARLFYAHEIALALFVALAAQAGIFMALRSSPSRLPVSTSPSPKAAPLAVKVNAAFELGEDAPLLKFGGKPDPSRLPDRSATPVQKVRAEEKAFVSTEAGKEAKDIPKEDIPLAKAEEKPPPPEAELTKQVDTPPVPAPETPPANIAEAGHQDGVKGGTETDPLKARAVDLYRARIISWFSRRFRVKGSGLSTEELRKYRVSATVHLSDTQGVMDYSIVPSGNAAFDAAALSALSSAKGQSLPPPPEDYPGIVQSQIHLTFVCREDRCD